MTAPGRILMTCDAVGGVWRYSVDLAGALERAGVEVHLVGTGPAPRRDAAAELTRPPRWLDLPPTWLAAGPSEVARLGEALARLAHESGAGLVPVNQPAEAACLDVDVPVVVAAHSCLATWWRSVRGGDAPPEWRWRIGLEADGLRRADAVVAPTAAHAAAVGAAYGIAAPAVVPNATAADPGAAVRDPLVVAAARWWDAGKNFGVLDAAAGQCRWPVLAFGGLAGPDGSRVVAHHARSLGARPSDEVRLALRRAAIFASPSLYEPFGLAALEAARSGAALVLADIPSYRELWDGAARFFDPRSPAGLAAALDELARRRPERDRLAAAAAARATAFNPAAQAEALLAVYAAAGADPRAALQAAG
jgi:glycosyltransferase involved in cell wall biosynthesis